MDKREFSQIRSGLEKTQDQLAQLLGISIKAVQSFEQGWRNIPVHTERQLLFLLTLKRSHSKGNGSCWVIRKCPLEIKQKCPAWEFQAGHLCWFINGTMCQGKVQESWKASAPHLQKGLSGIAKGPPTTRLFEVYEPKV